MKLHLPKMLAAALIAASTALIAGQQAQAATRTTVTTHTTQAGDVTYNGYVFTMLLSPEKPFATRDFKEAQYVQGAWVDVDPVYHSSNSAIQTPLGNGSFWHMYCSSTNVSSLPYGNTLHLSGATEVKLETNFSDFSIGGLIADDNSSTKNPTYWLYKNSNMTLNGTGAVNMDVNSHVRFSYANTVDMMKGGTWNIHSGKSLTFDNNSSGTATTFCFFEDQALTVKGGGTLNLGRSSNGTYNVNMKSGSSLHVTENSTVVMGAAGTLTANGAITVDEGSTLTITSLTTTLGHTITNNGNIQFASDTVTLGSLGGFDASGAYTDYSGEETGNGFAGTMVYTIIQGTGTSNLAKVNYGTQTAVALTDGKLTVEGDMDYTKYYLNTNDTTISVKSASEYAAQHEGAVLSTVYVKGASDTVDVDADFSGAIEVSGTGAVLNIKEGSVFSGTLTSATIQGAGTYALASGSKTMVGALAAGSGWTGTVALSDVASASGHDINLNTYGHAGSKVQLDDVTGYFLKAQVEFAPELVLAEGGLTLDNGYSTIDGGGDSKFTFAGGVSGEGDMNFNKADGNVTQHLYFTGDVADWTGALNVVDHFTVYAQYSGADQKVNSTISRTGGELHVEVGTGSDASVVTFSKAITADDLTVKAGATANINGGLTTSTITVDEGATLAINGNTTLTSAITSAGTVTLTDVALSDAFTESQGGEAKYYIEETQNYYKGSGNKYLTVVTGDGAANATGTGLTWTTLTGLEMANGQVITGAGEANYGTLYVGGDTTSADIVGYGHKEALTSIVVESGTLTVTEGELPQTVAITVSEHGTIAGDVEPTQVGIGAKATAEFTKPVETMGVRLTAAEGDTVKVTNNGEAAATYSEIDANLAVEAKTLEMVADEPVMVLNEVYVDEIVNNKVGQSLTLMNAQNLELKSMTIAKEAVVSMYFTEEGQPGWQEGTVTITECLNAGGAKLLANLTIADVNVEDGENPILNVNGGGDNALTLGSQFTIAEGTLVTLDAATIEALEHLEIDQTLDIIRALGGTTLTYGEDGEAVYDGMWFDALFARTTGVEGDYRVVADGISFGLKKVSNTPEPTTGTLSLLALAALAARRRKH